MKALHNYALLFAMLIFLLACKKGGSPLSNDVSLDLSTVDTAQLSIPSPILLPDSINQLPQKHLTIVILGSSTAVGIGSTEPKYSWAGLLETKVLKDGKDINFVNLAVSGYNTFQILPTGFPVKNIRPFPDALNNITAAISLNPDLVIINMPTNDISLNFSDEEILANYKTIIDLLEKKNIGYIITGTQPRDFPSTEVRNRLKILNDKLLITFPGNVVNYLAKLSKAGWYIADYYSTGDSAHLNNRGHRIIYQYMINFPVFKDLVGYR